MKLGIVGLPNVGKSTLFNSLTKAGAESANYPFCTIDPNVGVVTVPDERLALLGDFYHSKKVTPAVIEFVDIAGLVKGMLDKINSFFNKTNSRNSVSMSFSTFVSFKIKQIIYFCISYKTSKNNHLK